MDQLTLAQIMRKLGELPALPHVTTKVLQLIDNPESSSQDICGVLVQDQVLTTKVLRLVNSAYYGLPRKVATITEAVTILGFETVKTLVLGVSVYKTLWRLGKSKVLLPEQIWKHSIATASASRILAKEFNFEHVEQAFVAGLLHDIGKMVLNTLMAEQYEEVLKLVNTKEVKLMKAEREILEFDHAFIGHMVAQKWNLPETLVEPIGLHHRPMAAQSHSKLTYIVHLGNAIAILAGFGLGNDKDFHLDGKVLTKMNMSFDQLVCLASEVSSWVTSEVLL